MSKTNTSDEKTPAEDSNNKATTSDEKRPSKTSNIKKTPSKPSTSQCKYTPSYTKMYVSENAIYSTDIDKARISIDGNLIERIEYTDLPKREIIKNPSKTSAKKTPSIENNISEETPESKTDLSDEKTPSKTSISETPPETSTSKASDSSLPARKRSMIKTITSNKKDVEELISRLESNPDAIVIPYFCPFKALQIKASISNDNIPSKTSRVFPFKALQKKTSISENNTPPKTPNIERKPSDEKSPSKTLENKTTVSDENALSKTFKSTVTPDEKTPPKASSTAHDETPPETSNSKTSSSQLYIRKQSMIKTITNNRHDVEELISSLGNNPNTILIPYFDPLLKKSSSKDLRHETPINVPTPRETGSVQINPETSPVENSLAEASTSNTSGSQLNIRKQSMIKSIANNKKDVEELIDRFGSNSNTEKDK